MEKALWEIQWNAMMMPFVGPRLFLYESIWPHAKYKFNHISEFQK